MSIVVYQPIRDYYTIVSTNKRSVQQCINQSEISNYLQTLLSSEDPQKYPRPADLINLYPPLLLLAAPVMSTTRSTTLRKYFIKTFFIYCDNNMQNFSNDDVKNMRNLKNFMSDENMKNKNFSSNDMEQDMLHNDDDDVA